MYASRGIYVFPLWWIRDGMCACADRARCKSPGKHPRTRNGHTEASNDPAAAAAWWATWPEANIGLPAGGNGLAILDVDPAHGGTASFATLAKWCRDRHGIDLMATRIIRTGSGGLHLYYRQPVGGIKNVARAFRDAPGLDTRGRGGYVVAPPSLHASGNRYVVATERPLMVWPDVLTRVMEYMPPGKTAPASATAPRPAGATSSGERWAQAGLRSECDHLRGLAAGSGRNNALNGSAYKVGRRVGAGYLGEVEAAEALYDAARGWDGHTERELRATIVSGLRAGIANPHTGPAGRGGA